MNFSSAGYQLLPVLPELVLAVGAMALLMLGAYRGEGTTRLVTTLAVVLLVVTGLLELMLPAGKLTTFGGSFIVDDFARFLNILAIIGSAALKTGSVGIVFGLVFLLAGLCFKVSAVPFHMWTPDVYEGAPTPVTAFFASAPKVAALAVFTRVTLTAFPGIVPQWQQILVFVAIASMVLGSFAAIGQKNIKRLMAYSSIGHMGFALVGLAAGTPEGAQGVLVYFAIYVSMTLGSLAVIMTLNRKGQHV